MGTYTNIPDTPVAAALTAAVGGPGGAPITDADKREIDRLRSKHPEYRDKEEQWRFFAKAYEGGKAYVGEQTLHKHVRETQADFQDRLKRCSYRNYCAPLVDFIADFIFSQPISREADTAVKSDYAEFIKDVDEAGSDISTFMRELTQDLRIFGRVTVQQDKPAVPAGTDVSKMSRQDQADQKLDKPYWIRLSPLEILDWAKTRKGDYAYVKRIEPVREVDPATFELKTFERYHEWTPANYKVTDIDVTHPDHPKLGMTTVKPNPFAPVVPFDSADFKRGKTKKDSSLSFLEDIAYLNNDVFNFNSLGKEFLYKQCFNLYAMEAETSVPVADRQEGVQGTSNAVEVPKGGKFPEYISPDVAPAEHIQKETSIVVLEMYRIAAQDVLSELFAVTRSTSGDSGKQSFYSRSVPAIAKQADVLQAFELRLCKRWAQIQKKDWKDGKIAYKDDYSITNLLDLITQLTQVFRSILLPSPTFIRAEWLRIIREMDRSIPADKLEKIAGELDKMSDEDIIALYQNAGPMAASDGVPSHANAVQGAAQKGRTDAEIAAATGSKAATKEQQPDANKRTAAGQQN